MHIALRDARPGQGGARLDFDKDDLKDGACGHEHQRVAYYPKTCGEVTP